MQGSGDKIWKEECEGDQFWVCEIGRKDEEPSFRQRGEEFLRLDG